MHPQLVFLFVILNVPLFIGLRYLIKAQLFPELMAQQILLLFVLFLCIEHVRLYLLAMGRKKNLLKLTQSLANPVYLNGMAFLYIVYCTLSLATVVYYPSFPSIHGLFIILFVSQYLLLSVSMPTFVDRLLLKKFKYGLQQEEKVKNYLNQLSPYQGLIESMPANHGENRLSPIEIEAIDKLFKKNMQAEMKKELKQVLCPSLLLWSRLFSFVNAAIIALLFHWIVY